MKVALYSRVSTADKGQTPETQLLALREYAQRSGHEVVEEFADWGWSGAKEKRPSLDRLMQDCRKQRFEMVMVARFDRFARSTRHLLTALEEFQRHGVQFASLGENIDTSTPMGKAMFTMVAAFSELERATIRERVNLGLARARKEGKRLGRPTVLVDRALIRDKHRGGASISLIAKEAGISRSTVRAILKEAV